MLSMPMTDVMPSRLASSIDAATREINSSNKLSDATNMPSNRQTAYGIQNLTQVEKKYPEYNGTNLQFIRSRQSAPSAVFSENVLKARASLEKIFMHNTASIKKEHISNMFNDAPKFQKKIDILA